MCAVPSRRHKPAGSENSYVLIDASRTPAPPPNLPPWERLAVWLEWKRYRHTEATRLNAEARQWLAFWQACPDYLPDLLVAAVEACTLRALQADVPVAALWEAALEQRRALLHEPAFVAQARAAYGDNTPRATLTRTWDGVEAGRRVGLRLDIDQPDSMPTQTDAGLAIEAELHRLTGFVNDADLPLGIVRHMLRLQKLLKRLSGEVLPGAGIRELKITIREVIFGACAINRRRQ